MSKLAAERFAADPALSRRLTRFQAERDDLLQRARTVTEADPRICAAWLFGSLGRGDADALSDIDLFLIVEDGEYEQLSAQRYTYMSQLGEPLLILEAPQNWPPGGVYNMALYPGQDGPHQIDWYWVRRSLAAIPSETVVWFDRANLPRLDTPTHFDYAAVPERTPAEVASQAVNMFWVMLLIMAKYVARQPKVDRHEWLGRLQQLYEQAQSFAASPLTLPSSEPLPTSALDHIALLRQWAATMEQLMPAVVASGGYVPSHIPAQAQQYLAFISDLLTGAQV